MNRHSESERVRRLGYGNMPCPRTQGKIPLPSFRSQVRSAQAASKAEALREVCERQLQAVSELSRSLILCWKGRDPNE